MHLRVNACIEESEIPLQKFIRSFLLISSMPRLPSPTGTQPRCLLEILGVFIPRNGTDINIRAIKKLVKKYPKLKYIVVGDGRQREYLENLVKEFGLKNTLYLSIL